MKLSKREREGRLSDSVYHEIRRMAKQMMAQGKTAYRFWRELHEQGIKEYSLCDDMEPFNVRAMMDTWLSYTLRGARILHSGNPIIK